MQIYLCTTMSQSALGKKFGVSQATVNHIKRGLTWRWLTERLEKSP